MGNEKIIVIGLDGATWDLINPWMRDNNLPTMRKLTETGAYSNLTSTIPSYTLPSWTSLTTGVNPGKHGIYDVFIENKGSLKTVNSYNRKVKSIFEILDSYGKVSVAVNIPGTFPPDEINNGAMISGILTTPSENSNFVHPKSLKNDISDLFKKSFELENFQLSRYLSDKNKNKFIEILNDVAEEEANATINLTRRFKPHLLWHVFRTTDIAQHYLYDSKDIKSENNEYLLKHYKKVDSLIKKIIEDFPKKRDIFIVSDHGFAPLNKYFYVNTWLESEGLLKRQRENYRRYVNRSFIELGGSLIDLLTDKINFLDQTMLRMLKTRIFNKAINKIVSGNSIDFSKTMAYSPSYTSQSIKITEQSDIKRNKILNEIIPKLYRLEDIESGQKVIERVYKREDIYSGDYISEAPEILITTKEGYILTNMFSPDNVFLSPPSSLLGVKTGDHRPNGIFIASGEMINNFGMIDTIHVYDIAPTILSLLGIPIPRHMDGKVMKELFSNKIAIPKSIISQYKKEQVRNKIKELRDKGKI